MEAAKKADSIVSAKGDPRFNLNAVEPSKTIATAAYTDEDAALDRELDRLARETEPVMAIDPDVPGVKKTKESYALLSDVVEVKPASTVNELMDQVYRAKEHECDSIYATESMIKHYNRRGLPTEVGYFMFHDIKVYMEGHFEQSSMRDKQTIQEKVFGKNE